jgi:hypothetical protein
VVKKSAGVKALARNRKPTDREPWLLPEGKSRAAYYDGRRQTLDELKGRALLAEMQREVQAWRDHPDTAAKERIDRALQEAHLDPVVYQRSHELTRFVWLMRELLADFVPGMKVEQLLEPLRTLMSRHPRAGRPTKAEVRDKWMKRYDALKQKRPTLSAPEIWQDIAHEWEQSGHVPMTWRSIRTAVSKHRKALANGISLKRTDET